MGANRPPIDAISNKFAAEDSYDIAAAVMKKRQLAKAAEAHPQVQVANQTPYSSGFLAQGPLFDFSSK